MNRRERHIGAYFRYIRLTTRKILLDRSLVLPFYLLVAGLGMIAGGFNAIGSLMDLKGRPLYLIMAVGAVYPVYVVLTSTFFTAVFAFIVDLLPHKWRLGVRFLGSADQRAIDHISPKFLRREPKNGLSLTSFIILDIVLLGIVLFERMLLMTLEEIRQMIDKNHHCKNE